MHDVEFTPQAGDDLAHLDKPIAERILRKIRWLAENFEAVVPEPLTGPWRGLYKLRVGDFRILYTFGDGKIVVRLAGHRRDVYRT